MKTEKHCQRHGPMSNPYCVECWKDDHAKEKADERLEATPLFCVFHGRGGYDSERESANKDLEVGKQYQIVDVEMHASVTYITLEGWKHSYNTAMFDVDHDALYNWAHPTQNVKVMAAPLAGATVETGVKP